MSNAGQINMSTEQQYQGILERAVFSTATTVPCCVFLFINGTMLFTLRSKPVFRETSRYILLFNLLLADTVQMAVSQLLYIIAFSRVTLTYPVCGAITMLAALTNEISPLTLVIMSLERYVAVCYPLRHSAIVTVRNTGIAIVVIWAFSFLNIVTKVLIILQFPFEKLDTLQMKDFCSVLALSLNPLSEHYDKAYTCFLFISASVAISSSYVGVTLAARSASTDKTSARKARNTLVLHLLQLVLSLSSTIYNPFLIALSKIVIRIVFVRIQNVFYVCIFIFPRCLSSLIYGIRDQTIRPVLMCHLCCRLKPSVISIKTNN